ncbi:sodium/glutamate symporter [uncultured Umboniibacter sp.]|uniref:sodium/glutamate symporter n=1 Tax=uncultured Umboniibacter sp. TaxID=1798917 RepID=UPI00261A6B66|nr:sodium/glutamate symporter [uncultured Umboniibacter sp.]
MLINFTTSGVIVLSIAVLWVGQQAISRIEALARWQIPPAVLGGLLCSAVLSLISVTAGVEFQFDLTLRATLLLVFFASVGLCAKFSDIVLGGSLLLKLALATVLLLFLQNLFAVLLTLQFDLEPIYGLMAGSISLAGGHGTAISWGEYFTQQGFAGASDLGLAYATMGLIAGGLVGGPLGQVLIRFARKRSMNKEKIEKLPKRGPLAIEMTTTGVINAVLLFAICTGFGGVLNELMSSRGLLLPGFVTAMLVGVFVGNYARSRDYQVCFGIVAVIGDVCLNLFLAMSLMTMDLVAIWAQIGQIVMVMTGQILIVVGIAVFVVFPLAGRNYNAAVCGAGFAGIGLGATPVGVANMHSVTERYGPAPQAFIVIPLIGAGLLDLTNASMIKLWLIWLGY